MRSEIWLDINYMTSVEVVFFFGALFSQQNEWTSGLRNKQSSFQHPAERSQKRLRPYLPERRLSPLASRQISMSQIHSRKESEVYSWDESGGVFTSNMTMLTYSVWVYSGHSCSPDAFSYDCRRVKLSKPENKYIDRILLELLNGRKQFYHGRRSQTFLFVSLKD